MAQKEQAKGNKLEVRNRKIRGKGNKLNIRMREERLFPFRIKGAKKQPKREQVVCGCKD